MILVSEATYSYQNHEMPDDRENRSSGIFSCSNFAPISLSLSQHSSTVSDCKDLTILIFEESHVAILIRVAHNP